MVYINKKHIIKVSVALNIIFILVVSVLFINDWTISALTNKVTSVFTSSQQVKASTYYTIKVSQFNSLPITKDDVVFVGDSITDMGEWGELFNTTRVKNRGINGDVISGVSKRIKNIAYNKPKAIFLMIGTNDLNEKTNIADKIIKYTTITDIIKEVSPSTEIYIQSVLPINSSFWKDKSNASYEVMKSRTENNDTIKKFNKELAKLSKDEGYIYINLYDDFLDSNGNLDAKLTEEGLHINGDGYALWKSKIKKYVYN